jgi:transposase-like protein
MSHMEIITRTERRRRWSVMDRERILAECDVPGAVIKAVARRNDIAESMIYSWRAMKRASAALESEPLAFIPYGEVASKHALPSSDAAVLQALQKEGAAARREAIDEQCAIAMQPHVQKGYDLIRPHPGNRPGTIDMVLTSGVALTVDAFVNEKALARVLKVLGHCR